jgi:molybdopterin synthase sulfur carrier subunit
MRILFFGRLGEAIGREIEIDPPAEPCTVADLRAQLAIAYPVLADRGVRGCVDRAIVPDTAPVRAGQEVAFMPPLSGG